MRTKIISLIFTVSMLLVLGFSVHPQLRLGGPENNQIHVTGDCYVTLYLNGNVTLSRNGTPLVNQNVYMNSLKLPHRGGGQYTGAIISSPYIPAVGNTITIKLKPGAGRIFTPGKSKLLKEMVLGRYTLTGYVKWKHPGPNTVIAANPIGPADPARRIRFTWDHFGTDFRARVKIRNMTHNREVFNRTVQASAEEIRVPAIIIQRGDRYQFHIGGDKPLGKFSLTKHVTKRSRIVFYWSDVIYVNAK